MPASSHEPVMLEEVIAALRPRPGGFYVDLTVGVGGHARRILEESAPDGRLLGVDRDSAALDLAASNLAPFKNRLRLAHGNSSELPRLLELIGQRFVDGMLADLGVSSVQLDRPERGFSFQRPGPIDMRMDPSNGEPLIDSLGKMDVKSLANVLERLGEVPRAQRVARQILVARDNGVLRNTLDLALAAAEGRRRGGIHPATRSFLALRRMVNREQEELAAVLDWLPEPLKVGGRVVLIAFHSLEDRAIKRRLTALEGKCRCPPGLPVCRCGQIGEMRLLTRRAVQASKQEMVWNPRARSARLRAAERIAA